MLQNQGLGQERLLLRYCRIGANHYNFENRISFNWLNEHGITDINQHLDLCTDEELRDFIILGELLPTNSKFDLYSRFAIEPFQISSISIWCDTNMLNHIDQKDDALIKRLTEIDIHCTCSHNLIPSDNFTKFVEKWPYLDHIKFEFLLPNDFSQMMENVWSVNQNIAFCI